MGLAIIQKYLIPNLTRVNGPPFTFTYDKKEVKSKTKTRPLGSSDVKFALYKWYFGITSHGITPTCSITSILKETNLFNC